MYTHKNTLRHERLNLHLGLKMFLIFLCPQMSDSDVDLTPVLLRRLNFTKSTKNILYINMLWTHGLYSVFGDTCEGERMSTLFCLIFSASDRNDQKLKQRGHTLHLAVTFMKCCGQPTFWFKRLFLTLNSFDTVWFHFANASDFPGINTLCFPPTCSLRLWRIILSCSPHT